MEHSELVARLLKQVATARAAIAAGYLRLWRSEGPSPIDPNEAGVEATRRDTEVSATRDRQPSQDDR
ncbi:MAG: hypothetical protein WBP81_39355 [Solirubrobacteraceae bacterium]